MDPFFANIEKYVICRCMRRAEEIGLALITKALTDGGVREHASSLYGLHKTNFSAALFLVTAGYFK